MKKIALITGASSGIGKELAKIHANKGGDLILVARTKSKLEALKEQLESKYDTNVFVIPSDLSVLSNIPKLFKQVEKLNLTIDYLINNAGVSDIKKFDTMEWNYTESMIDLNIKALTQLTYLFLPQLKKTKGKILNVSSTASYQPIPNQAVYAASKAYVTSLSVALAEELAPYKISVTTLCPGPTDTNIDANKAVNIEALQKSFLMQKPEEVAKMGYKAMLKGDGIIISGLANKITAFSSRFVSKSVTAKVSKFIFEKAMK